MMRVLICVLLMSCGRDDARPSNQQAEPAGSEKTPSTKVLEKGAEALQDLTPVRQLETWLNGFHTMKDDPQMQMEAQHYCHNKNEELTQCVIFDGTGKDANLIGIEYIISDKLFDGLAPEERKMWHPHNYEILSGTLVAKGVPEVAEKALMKKKMNSYGKTWHVWDTGHHGHPAGSSLPIGAPKLAWSFNHDGEMNDVLRVERDKRLGIDSAGLRRSRADLASLGKPQEGVDAIKFPSATGAPSGVQGK
jgi:hypothetical protein